MNPAEAAKLARSLMDKHGITSWTFKFDSANIRFGCCDWEKKTISLSLNMTAANSVHDVKETILHEIAHALVGRKHGHDFAWKMKCLEIGCPCKRCYSQHVKNAARGWK